MIRSMTGFGRGSAAYEDGAVACEVRSVNHRFCDVKVRAPREFLWTEGLVTAGVRERLARGSVTVSLRWERRPASGVQVVLDRSLLEAYRTRLQEMAEILGVEARLDPLALATFDGVLVREEVDPDAKGMTRAIRDALGVALDGVIAMRIREGEALAADLRTRLKTLRTQVSEIERIAAGRVEARRDRLQARLDDLLGDATLSSERLAQEVAILADRLDVSEEIERLRAHLDALDGILDEDGPVGRKLDFLVQELGREANTVGSKAQDADLGGAVVALKAEIERVREQVQNVE